MSDDDARAPMTDLTCDEVRDLAASFVLGALDADEAQAVRAHLAGCADAHAEIVELGGVLPALAASVPQVEPRPALKARILAAAAADLESRTTAESQTLVPPTPAPIAFPSTTERADRAVRRGGPAAGAWVLRIAAVLAIALLGGWNLLLQGQLDQSRTYEQQVAAVLDVAGQPGALTAVLTAEGGDGPSGLAAVAADGTVTLAMRGLAPTNGDQVYEAWAIGGDGTPVALGGFQVGTAGIAYFEGDGLPTDPGLVLALTLEPGPGATAPTSPVVSLGTTTAG
ncbi:MAG: anti-sigma factor domain-containing protein [Candidatus Limnocylindrales bacterium]